MARTSTPNHPRESTASSAAVRGAQRSSAYALRCCSFSRVSLSCACSSPSCSLRKPSSKAASFGWAKVAHVSARLPCPSLIPLLFCALSAHTAQLPSLRRDCASTRPPSRALSTSLAHPIPRAPRTSLRHLSLRPRLDWPTAGSTDRTHEVQAAESAAAALPSEDRALEPPPASSPVSRPPRHALAQTTSQSLLPQGTSPSIPLSIPPQLTLITPPQHFVPVDTPAHSPSPSGSAGPSPPQTRSSSRPQTPRSHHPPSGVTVADRPITQPRAHRRRRRRRTASPVGLPL